MERDEENIDLEADNRIETIAATLLFAILFGLGYMFVHWAISLIGSGALSLIAE